MERLLFGNRIECSVCEVQFKSSIIAVIQSSRVGSEVVLNNNRQGFDFKVHDLNIQNGIPSPSPGFPYFPLRHEILHSGFIIMHMYSSASPSFISSIEPSFYAPANHLTYCQGATNRSVSLVLGENEHLHLLYLIIWHFRP